MDLWTYVLSAVVGTVMTIVGLLVGYWWGYRDNDRRWR